jgi:1-acyl-sn-glycerol-3-phosphate acyltransferase
MILSIIWLILSLGAAASTYYFLGLYQQWYWIFVPILMVPLGYLVCFGLHCAYMWFTGLFNLKRKVADHASRYVYWEFEETTWQALFLMGARIKVTGKELLKGRKGPFVIINNHLSDFDQFVIISRFRGYPLICVSKPENFNIPVAGPWMGYGGYLAINRDDAFEAVKTIRRASQIVGSKQASIGISPEGTRSKDHQIHEFKPGAFKVATWGKQPLVVCCLHDTWKIPHNFKRLRPTKINLDILEVIEPETFQKEDTVTLANHCHDLIAARLSQLDALSLARKK